MSRTLAIAIVALLALAACTPTQNGPLMTDAVVPAPVSQKAGEGSFELRSDTAIVASGEAEAVGRYLAESLRPATGFAVPISTSGTIELAIEPSNKPGGYSLTVSPDGIRLSAPDASSLFSGVQTLRQLLPTEIEAHEPVDRSWTIDATTIVDYPRFAYRGAMLDVARHFFGVDDVKKYIDDIALLKLNVLHLHLTDDQGWRLEITGWPRLTEHGGSTQVGGGGGGYYTHDDYREIVEYAASRYITIVPEIDMPGHTNAALASYPELTCDGVAPELYEGIEVGFSSLCIDNERTYEFIDDVIRDLIELTPGPWIHIGGDESNATTDEEFLTFIRRATVLVASRGKTVIGWHEMGKSDELPRGTIGQYWNLTTPEGDTGAHANSFVDQGGQLIMSPADVAYLDMKYDASSPLGLVWAGGPTTVTEAYSWDPGDILPGIGDAELLGVEAPIWTETLTSIEDVELMAFPRIAAIAEIAWSPQPRDYDNFSRRLAALGQRLEAAGINYFRAPDVAWGK